MTNKFTAADARELVIKHKTFEAEKELQDILLEIRDQASKGSSSITTWISHRSKYYILQKLHDLHFVTEQSGDQVEDFVEGLAHYKITWL